MSNVTEINVERTGFPVTLNGVKLWFSTSPESLLKYVNLSDVVFQKEKELAKEAENLKLPDAKKIEESQSVSAEDVSAFNKALDFKKQIVAIQYDELFGLGTFEKVYKALPDTEALEGALQQIGDMIAERLHTVADERSGIVSEKARAYAKKKQQKAK